jgi:hypothetical protein
VAHKHKEGNQSLSFFLPSGFQNELGQKHSRKTFRFPCIVRKTFRVAPKKKKTTRLPAPFPLTRHLRFSLPPTCQPEDTATIKDPVYRIFFIRFHPCPSTYPSEIVPAPHDRAFRQLEFPERRKNLLRRIRFPIRNIT